MHRLLINISRFITIASLGGLLAVSPKEDPNLEGRWTGFFQYQNGLRIPFQFEINKSKSLELYFINADERFRSGDLEPVGDSLIARLDPFDNELVISQKGDSISGWLRRQDGKWPATAIKAYKGAATRFPQSAQAVNTDISGTYETRFIYGDKEEPSVALLKQEGSVLKASFLRISGDSRYLEGVVVNDSFYLSSFIGSSPSFYRGAIHEDGSISGETVSARGPGSKFIGRPNEEAALPDAYTLTTLREGYTKFDFSFPDLEGNKVSLSDSRFQNKVVVVTIGGTWCPNCMDESVFLAEWYRQNKSRGVEVVGIQYERSTDAAYLKKTIQRFRQKTGIEYPQAIGGLADKQAVVASLPALNSFLSFPTIIFINKQGEVAGIHTGFAGPATGQHYKNFVVDFNHRIDSLLKS